MTARRKRLIEVAFPLEEVSAHSRHEKNIRHGHISTLHIWWARRPLAACRAFIYASLVDDPIDPAEREELLKEVADLASWTAVRQPDQVVRSRAEGGSGLSGTQLLERAWRRILAANGGRAPRLLDPFSGGGAIPLEALRLGCEAEASDLNPVATLILKGTVEYPQRYGRPLTDQRTEYSTGKRDSIAGVDGQVPTYIRESAARSQSSFAESDAVAAYERNPLAADVRYWGNWLLERARAELSQFYPPDPDGSVPVAYLWSRTVPCPNCGAEMPLIRQYWLARKDKKKVALQPIIDRENKRIDFKVVEGPHVTGDPAEATTSRGDTVCLNCHQIVKASYVHEAGRRGEMGERLIAVVLEAEGPGGKTYREARSHDYEVFAHAERARRELESQTIYDLPAIPDEPLAFHPQYMLVREYGLDQWGKLFNSRQLVSLTHFARLVAEAYAAMVQDGVEHSYAEAVATYLGLAVDRLADRGSSLCRWDSSPKMEALVNTFARQALPMVWDYGEGVPFSEAAGGFTTCISWILYFLELEGGAASYDPALVTLADARVDRSRIDIVVTDPPYYDAINYADLSDFFYVWLKRSIGFLHPELLSIPLTPKKQQLVVNFYAQNGSNSDTERKEFARRHYIDGMSQAFGAMSRALQPSGLVGVVFAHTGADAWTTLIEGLLHSRLIPIASWPIDTELQNKTSASSRANLKTSVWMACRPRDMEAGEAFIEDVLAEMRPVMRERLLYFWGQGIRGADFFISAIGPALSVFGRHSQVFRPDGSEVTVREFLDLVRRESSQVALEQVLHGADLGTVDSLSRLFVAWVWSHSRAPLDAGEAIALCLATGADYREVVRQDSIAAEVKDGSKKVAKLRSIRERGAQDDTLGKDTPARPAPLIDQLQRAAHLWSLNHPAELAAFRLLLGEPRWAALRVLGQAIAECLPDGDEDRRLLLGLLGSSAMNAAPPRPATGPLVRAAARPAPTMDRLPGIDDEPESR